MIDVVAYSFLVLLVAYDLWSTGRVSSGNDLGRVFLVVMQELELPIGSTAVWQSFATWVLERSLIIPRKLMKRQARMAISQYQFAAMDAIGDPNLNVHNVHYRVLHSGNRFAPWAALLLYALVLRRLTAPVPVAKNDWLFRLLVDSRHDCAFLVTLALAIKRPPPSMRFPYLRKQVWPSQFSHSASLGNLLTTASSARAVPKSGVTQCGRARF